MLIYFVFLLFKWKLLKNKKIQILQNEIQNFDTERINKLYIFNFFMIDNLN